MRSLTLRPGETFVIGDTAISAENQVAQLAPPEDRVETDGQNLAGRNRDAAPENPIQHQSTQQWLAAYEREERRQDAAARSRRPYA